MGYNRRGQVADRLDDYDEGLQKLIDRILDAGRDGGMSYDELPDLPYE